MKKLQSIRLPIKLGKEKQFREYRKKFCRKKNLAEIKTLKTEGWRAALAMQAYNTAKSGCSVASMDKLFKFANKVKRLNHSNNPIEIKVVNVIMRNQ